MSLRNQVMRGGAYLVVRQGLAQVIKLGGVLLLSRAIGPTAYGLYAGALGIYLYVTILSQWGIGVYLVRREGPVPPEVYDQAFTFLLLTGVAASAATSLATPLLERWLRLQNFGAIALVLFASLPLKLPALVASARLERALDFRQIALVELACQAIYYVVALAMAYGGLGPWSPVGGWWAQQLLALVLLFRAAKYRPRFHWDRSLIKEMVDYGLGYSSSIWIWQLRELVNPLVVGRYLGAEAMAYIALAVRMVKGLSFVLEATTRLSMAALARLQNDTSRIVRAVSEGMRLMVLSLGPMLVGFGLISPWLLPLFVSSQWLPVVEIFPFVAASSLATGMFSLHSSVLYVFKLNWRVAAFHLVHIVLFAGSAFLLVPRIGLVGYGLAELCAMLSYAVIHAFVVRHIGMPDYRVVGIWWMAFVLALFWQRLGWWAGLGLVGVLLWPKTWQQLRGYLQNLWVAVSER
jgi:O-antigen/teichoic acid export membrane protein